MSRLKPLECVNCGAPLERDSLQCEYCGTRYAAEGAPAISNAEATKKLLLLEKELAQFITRLEGEQVSLVKDPIYPLAAYPHTSAEAAGKKLERRKQYENI